MQMQEQVMTVMVIHGTKPNHYMTDIAITVKDKGVA